MRILVAGGAGFIGRCMCSRLLDRGDEVICVDNLVTGTVGNVKDFQDEPGYTFVEADIASLAEFDAGPLDAVVNLACPASPADFVPLSLEILETGSRGVVNLLELCVRTGARFLQASTSEVYGDPQVHPQPESYWGNVNPVGLRSVYDEAKRFGEALTMAYQRRHGVEVRIARIFNTYGPGMRHDDGRVVSNFATQALRGEPLTVYGDGTQTRSLCFVEDEVTGLLALLESDVSTPVNIGNDDERTIAEIASLIIELAGSKSEMAHLPLPADDPTQRRPDLTIARTKLGWEPVTPLRDGLARTVEWFRATAAR
ncbi:MAG TPA: UDP-glucuronic acid decarboxylase family protein [Acidimicrobiales bacterium]|nr:UDP-glucuronic acid decarboxylase family protein [Acidimicrobiales bacterium]